MMYQWIKDNQPKLPDYYRSLNADERKICYKGYEKRMNEFHNKFWEKLADEWEVTNNPKLGKLQSIAWERGHSGGYYEVLGVFEELVELIV